MVDTTTKIKGKNILYISNMFLPLLLGSVKPNSFHFFKIILPLDVNGRLLSPSL